MTVVFPANLLASEITNENKRQRKIDTSIWLNKPRPLYTIKITRNKLTLIQSPLTTKRVGHRKFYQSRAPHRTPSGRKSSISLDGANQQYKGKKLTRARRLLRHDCFLEPIGLDATYKRTAEQWAKWRRKNKPICRSAIITYICTSVITTKC